MKNDVMIKLAGYRKIYDLIFAWIGDEHPIYADFEVDKGIVYLGLYSNRFGNPIDETAVATIKDMFLDGAPVVDSDVDMRMYKLGEAKVKFTVVTVKLLEYATDKGFIVGADVLSHAGGDNLIDFIRDNPEFTISVNEEGEVVIA